MAFTSIEVENTLRTIFRRCVQCPDVAPSCPSCPDGQICSQISASCTQCARTMCITDPTQAGGGSSKSSGPNVGAIAGGVIGGIAFIALVTYLVWRFCIKNRKQELEEEQWQHMDAPVEKAGDDFTMRRDARASTHTVASLASTVLTRASNIIQIAYIPGVTNRQGPGSPDLLVPPVPPIPSAMSPSTIPSSPYSTEDQIFFAPGDLRDSTYSGFTDGRSSYARTSIAPSLARSSVATTIYRSNAIVSPVPAQTIVRGKAAVVSVKSSNSSTPIHTPGAETPPVPSIDAAKFATKPIRIQMPGMASANSLSPAGSIRSTATVGKPVPLNITKKGKAMAAADTSKTVDEAAKKEPSTLRPLSEVSANTESTHARARQSLAKSAEVESEDSDSDGDEHARSRRSLLGHAETRDSTITEIQDTPATIQGPFADPTTEPTSPVMLRRSSTRRSVALPVVLEEKSNRSSGGSVLGAQERDRSPFSDENAVEK